MGRKKLLQPNDVLEVINRWLVEHGLPPTVEELRKALGLGSVRTVLRYLGDLEEAGEIRRWAGARGLQPLKAPKKGLETVTIPVVGHVSAGPLMIAEQNIEGWVRIPKNLIRPASNKFFLLRIRGDSMNRAMAGGHRIEDGDLVLVRQQSNAQPGDIVVSLIDGEATVKRLAKGPGYSILKPESSNREHKPIILTREFAIQGVVREVLKKGCAMLGLIEQ